MSKACCAAREPKSISSVRSSAANRAAQAARRQKLTPVHKLSKSLPKVARSRCHHRDPKPSLAITARLPFVGMLAPSSKRSLRQRTSNWSTACLERKKPKNCIKTSFGFGAKAQLSLQQRPGQTRLAWGLLLAVTSSVPSLALISFAFLGRRHVTGKSLEGTLNWTLFRFVSEQVLAPAGRVRACTPGLLFFTRFHKPVERADCPISTRLACSSKTSLFNNPTPGCQDDLALKVGPEAFR